MKKIAIESIDMAAYFQSLSIEKKPTRAPITATHRIMNIRQRISLLVILTFIAIAAIGGFAVFQSRGNAADVRIVTEGVVPSALATAELVGQLKDVQLATIAMVSASDSNSAAQAKENLAARKDALQNALDLQLKQADSQAQRGLVEQTQESLINYFAAIDETANFKIKGDLVMAEAYLAANVAEYLREQTQIISTLQIEKRRSKDSAISSLNERLVNTTQAIALVTIIAVFVIGGMGIILYRQIIRPISQMQKSMTDVATSQDFTHRVPVERMDEIGLSLMAFNTMIETIHEASELVKQKTADIQAMLRYIPQGIFTVGEGNIVHSEFSAFLETILETKVIAGRNLMDLVFSDSNCSTDVLSQIESVGGACIGGDVMNFEFNEHLLVHEIEKKMPDGRIKIIDLNWSPITDENDIIVRLMLCLWDVTELRSLAVEANGQKRELAMIGEILAVNQEKFHAFIDGANHFILKNEELLKEAAKTPDRVDAECIGKLFRNMHTIKGNARTYGLLQLTNLVHEAEQAYDELRKNPQAVWDHDALLSQLATIDVALGEYFRINDVKLGRKGPGRRGGVDKFLMVQKDHIHESIELLDNVDTNSVDSLNHAVSLVRKQLQLIGTEKIEDVLAGVIDSLPSLAKELDKEAPKNIIVDNGLVIRSQISDMIRNVCMHLYRNSMDHGIESADKRVAQGKSPVGQIHLSLQVDEGLLKLKLRDDGRGLAVGFIRQKANDKGLIADDQELSQEQIAQLIFLPGFSTADHVTEVSGRGVGMDAVNGFVQDEGGSLELCFLGPEAADGFRPFETVISLPEKFAVQVSL
jgi:two-component system chemotaxis sensor kinase CheA